MINLRFADDIDAHAEEELDKVNKKAIIRN